MLTIDAQKASRTAIAAAARRRAVSLGGTGLGMYPCAWHAGSNVDTRFAIFADTTSHKAWRPKEPSP
jgi:hypothetical protein